MKVKLSLITSIFILFLMGCQKGDPGPAGATGATGAAGADGATGPAGPDASQKFINGAFAGTVTGTKKDGSPLKETFNYPYAGEIDGYSQSSPPTLYLYRAENYGNNASYLAMTLVALNKGLANQSITLSTINYNNYFSFVKETSPTSLFEISGSLILADFNVVIPIDTLKKSTYPLDFSFYYQVYPGQNYWYLNNVNYLNENGQSYPGFRTVDGATVYFNSPGVSSGSFYKIIDAAGNVSNTSTTYGGLTVHLNANNNWVFFDSGANDISLTVPMKADTYSLTNYKYDTSTATLSFDFTMKMGGYPYPNSTHHPLTITGSFTGKVYDSITNGTVKGSDTSTAN